MLDALKERYGKENSATLYGHFKAAMDVKIPDNSHPGAAIEKILMHFARMAQFEADVEESSTNTATNADGVEILRFESSSFGFVPSEGIVIDRNDVDH